MLHYAARNGHLNVVGALIGSGADVNIQDKDGNTPLHTAVLEGDNSKALNLLKKGARTDIKNNDGKTALQIAKEENSESEKAIECKVKAESQHFRSACCFFLGALATCVSTLLILLAPNAFKESQNINLIKTAAFLPALMLFVAGTCFFMGCKNKENEFNTIYKNRLEDLDKPCDIVDEAKLEKAEDKSKTHG